MSFSQKQSLILCCLNHIGISVNPTPYSGGFLNPARWFSAFLWSTRKKLMSNLKIEGFDKVMSYLVVVYASWAYCCIGFCGLVDLYLWPTLIDSALADNFAINDLNEKDSEAFDQFMENLPSLLPMAWVFVGLQRFHTSIMEFEKLPPRSPR